MLATGDSSGTPIECSHRVFDKAIVHIQLTQRYFDCRVGDGVKRLPQIQRGDIIRFCVMPLVSNEVP